VASKLARRAAPLLRALGIVGFFGVLTVVHTWPLAKLPWNRMHSNADSMTGLWSLYGLSQQLVHQPWNLFGGTIFYPFPNTLTVLDHQIANAVMSAPLLLAGATDGVVYGWAMLASFFLSGLFTFLLVRRLTGSTAAALVSGCAFAFCAFRAQHVVQLHLLTTQWLPLALWALHRYLDRQTWQRWGMLAICALLVALSSWHIAVLGSLCIGIVALWTLVGDFRHVRRRVVGLASVGALCGTLLVPLALAYAQMGRYWPPRTGDGRETMGTLVKLSADVAGLVARPSNVRAAYMDWLSTPEYSNPGVFPGIVVLALTLPALALLLNVGTRPSTTATKLLRAWLGLALALVVIVLAAAAAGTTGEMLVALLRPLAPFVLFGLALAAVGLVLARRVGDTAPALSPIVTYAAVAAAGVLLALGPRVYAGGVDVGSGLWRLDLLPIGLIIRAPARLSLLLMLGVSVLAGIGTARLLRPFSPRNQAVFVALILIAINADQAFSMPRDTTIPPPRAFETWLAESAEEGAVVDYPLRWQNMWAVSASQRYGRRVVNGAGYLFPWEYKQMQELPDFAPEQLELLWEHFHPRFVVVRTDVYRPGERAGVLARIESRPDALQPLARFGPDYIYELFDRGRGTELLRSWPFPELTNKDTLDIEAMVAPGRPETVGELVVALNNHVLLEVRGEDAASPQAYSVSFGPEHLRPGRNEFHIWGDYRFTPAAPRHAIGSTGVTVAADITVNAHRERARVQVNGWVRRPGKGYFLAVLDAATGEVVRSGEFNVSWHAAESDALAAFVRDIPDGSPVIVVTEYDASRELQESAVEALRDLGFAVDLRGQFLMLHAGIGVKGAEPGSAMEATHLWSATLELGQPDAREVQLHAMRVGR